MYMNTLFNYNRSLPADQSLTPHSHHTPNKCWLIIPYLIPVEVFYQPQIIILSCMYFWLFPWQPTLCSIFPLFQYLCEVDIISTVRPYTLQWKKTRWFHTLHQYHFHGKLTIWKILMCTLCEGGGLRKGRFWTLT